MRVTVVIPALNEQDTIVEVIKAVAKDHPDQILVIDADSTDDTARRALQAGAEVLNWREIFPEIPTQPGKGESLWRGVWAAKGEIVVFIDADLIAPQPGMVTALASPFVDPDVHLVKANYQRTLNGQPTGGGRVTELSARPLLLQLFPALAHIRQPLAGEYAIRRATAMDLPFVAGYGVEAGLLVDVANSHGAASITQVDLGVRRHRNRPLSELAPMAEVVVATLLQRSGIEGMDVLERPALSSIL
ncbi:glucosyl-3-phosphoglycerate synthase [Corynebacterium alimapuense]|uniref:Glucosyl-3-phosphoglycerate synthase n=1 Tax=Corynebacterium alimapuense TaxID=1576874 RepID=A0A3M8K6T1_9CORY|nr:glucosyl-3-phosphoglycerate synthase [Corynebacterium alimapuense]RNE48465.1 glucosyl-3-phosphoglycerate synthase [Corynebacterium alimapuense]